MKSIVTSIPYLVYGSDILDSLESRPKLIFVIAFCVTPPPAAKVYTTPVKTVQPSGASNHPPTETVGDENMSDISHLMFMNSTNKFYLPRKIRMEFCSFRGDAWVYIRQRDQN